MRARRSRAGFEVVEAEVEDEAADMFVGGED